MTKQDTRRLASLMRQLTTAKAKELHDDIAIIEAEINALLTKEQGE